MMKKLLILFTALMLASFQLNAYIPDGDEGEDPEEIELTQQGGEDPTSSNTCLVQAFKTQTTVFVMISNFTGSLSAVVYGGSGNLFEHKSINGSGLLVIDISSLNGGDYSIVIQAGHCYLGFFTIK